MSASMLKSPRSSEALVGSAIARDQSTTNGACRYLARLHRAAVVRQALFHVLREVFRADLYGISRVREEEQSGHGAERAHREHDHVFGTGLTDEAAKAGELHASDGTGPGPEASMRGPVASLVSP